VGHPRRMVPQSATARHGLIIEITRRASYGPYTICTEAMPSSRSVEQSNWRRRGSRPTSRPVLTELRSTQRRSSGACIAGGGASARGLGVSSPLSRARPNDGHAQYSMHRLTGVGKGLAPCTIVGNLARGHVSDIALGLSTARTIVGAAPTAERAWSFGQAHGCCWW
jgi:hypothetical protein